MDIRTFGKGYEQFYQNARSMGVEFVKAKVASITQDENQNPVLRLEAMDGKPEVVERTHDLVVLSVGMLPQYDPQALYEVSPAASDGFVKQPSPNLAPSLTDRQGIFVAGTAAGPMDIVDSIVMAGAAAASAAGYIEERLMSMNGKVPANPQMEVSHA
jgi:heterodisulfide reductase subunit A